VVVREVGFECDLIRMRTSEGQARTVVRGVRLDAGQVLTPHQQLEAIKHRDRRDEMSREIARSYNFSHSTIWRPNP
jgi:hypothetical protein